MPVDEEILAGTSTVLLLSDELIDDEDDDVYMEDYAGEEEEEDEFDAVAGTEMDDLADTSFEYLEDEDAGADASLVEENPFEPVYPATAGLLFADEDVENVDDEVHNGSSDSGSAKVQGRVLEPVSLDNILPEGSRRRRG